MTKTVEQAVEETGGDIALIKGSGNPWADHLHCDKSGSYFFDVTLHSSRLTYFVGMRSEYEQAAAQWKAKQDIAALREKRRAKQAGEWVNGLPPVGTTNDTAELFGLGYRKPEYEVVAHHYNEVTAVVAIKTENGLHVSFAKSEHFRPILSDRDKAIEEMMNGLSYALTSHKTIKSVCCQLYDANYRKSISSERAYTIIQQYVDELPYLAAKDKRIKDLMERLGWEPD